MGKREQPLAVVAFGGNALLRPEDRGTQEEQIARAKQAARWLAEIVRHHYKLIVVHGNGPQVGNILVQAEEASTKIPPQTLDVCVAQTEGSIGFMLQQAIRNRLEAIGERGEVATILTEVEVDPNDIAFKRPTKPIGPFFTRYRAEALERDLGWTMREDSGRGWRHVVPSPRPLHILNIKTVDRMLDTASVVIAAGGGGVPVVKGRDGQWRGIEAVIDKDFASALLASELEADLFIILTGVPKVAIDFGKPTQRFLERMTVAEVEQHLADGQFPPGSMGPKVQSAIQFVRATGKEVLITDVEVLREALDGRDGTVIAP
ncbi:MAG: carbamate kinase [Acidobacteria bacterium]|nr:carbamate kinase [Acidobacteriota bacterium]MBV9475667.1 carbamate kinase [Acidobacteriota bacterium]